MFGSIRAPLTSLLSASSPFASTSRHVLAPPLALRRSVAPVQSTQVRYRVLLAPRRTKYRKAHKGFPISAPTGGSIRGTTVALGEYGLRLLEPTRLSAAVLTACRDALKRKIKTVKGAKVHLRVFPDIPVGVKGNETRMGKGKGAFEFWACRVPMGRVVFEIGGGGVREEIAKQAFKLAQAKLPVPSEFISRASPPRLGNIVSHELTAPPAAQTGTALLKAMQERGHLKVVKKIAKREAIAKRETEREFGGLKVLGPRMVRPSQAAAQ